MSDSDRSATRASPGGDHEGGSADARAPFVFDRDTSVHEVSPDVFRAEISDRWNVGPIPNGGYLLAIALRAIGRALPGREPRTVTAHYLRPAKCAPVEVLVERVKEGRRHATAMARMVQAAGEHVRVLATYASPEPAPGPEAISGAPPALPSVEEAFHARPPDFITIGKRFDVRYAPETAGFLQGAPTGVAELRAWVRFDDGREPDVWSLPLIADALPPPLLNVASFRWVPTIELTVHVRGRPAPGWLRTVFRSRFVFGGYLEADGEIWDSSGKLVAQSRQLMAAGEG